jgi:hypothetical protein
MPHHNRQRKAIRTQNGAAFSTYLVVFLKRKLSHKERRKEKSKMPKKLFLTIKKPLNQVCGG